MNALITNIINNLIHGLWFYSLVLEPKHSHKKTMGISAGAAVVSQAVMMVLFMWMYRPTLPFGGAISAKMLYFCGYCVTALIFGVAFVFLMSASEPVKSLFVLSAYCSFWTVIYLVISIVTNTFAGAGNLAVWGLRLGLNLPLLVIFQKYFKKKMQRMYKEIQIGYGTVAVVSVFAFLVMTIVIFYNEKAERHDWLYIAMILSTGSMMVIIHVLLLRFIAQAGYADRLKQMQLHEKYLQAQISSYEQMEQNARQTRHDIRHHHMVVAEYAREKDYQGILSYLQEYERLETEKYTGAYCKNSVVNNVLCTYIGKARRNGTEVSSDIRLGDTGEISNYDLVTILANILENAVNACDREEGKCKMEVSLRQKGSKLIFICKNTCTGKVKFEDGIPCSQERVSVGISSVRCCVDKYDGSVNFSAANGMFTCQVILNSTGNKNKVDRGKNSC